MHGRIAGINTAIFTRSGGSQGIGFAIPSNMVRVVVKSALHGGKVKRPWLGAELQPITADIAEAAGLDRPSGALVASVVPGGPAAKADLKPGDVIVKVDGRVARDPQAVLYRFVTNDIGEQAKLEVVRQGRTLTTTVALVVAPETVPRNARLIEGSNPFTGATVANLSPAVAEELSIREVEGVVVMETKAYSPARRFGLKPGDVLLKLNGAVIKNVKQFVGLLSKPSHGWDFSIRRGGVVQRAFIR
jgi:S1-C subfamily serine protease